MIFSVLSLRGWFRRIFNALLILADGFTLCTVHETHEKNQASYALSFRERGNNAQFISATTLDAIPLFILPLLEKIGLAQWRVTFMPGIGQMMPGIKFKVLLISVITR